MYIDTKYNCNVVMELNTYRHWEGQLVNISGGGGRTSQIYSYREYIQTANITECN